MPKGVIARTLVITLVGLSATACSTLIRGGHQTLTFQADSPNATMYVDSQTVTLPAKVVLSRKHSHTILITAPDRQPVQFTMKPKFDGASLGNLIYPGGSVGMLTDFLTGADKAFTPVGKITLPHTNPAPGPTLVLLHQHKSKLLTRQELDALKATPSAEVTEGARVASEKQATGQLGG